MDDGRKQRGLEIATRLAAGIKKGRLGWRVPSQSGNGSYIVNIEDVPSCSCPDFENYGHFGQRCKHIWAIEFRLKREIAEDGSIIETKSVKVTYSQDWPAYNKAQVNEKDRFQILLRDLCSTIEEPRRTGRGRPPIPIADQLFSATYKVYSTVSGRRFMSDLRAAHEKGFISRLPCYNSVFNVFDSEKTSPLLTHLVNSSSLPLKTLETKFACDSSGFSSSRFDRWYDEKWGKKRSRRRWVKAHLMTGTRTNTVTALEISPGGDAPMLPELLNTTAKNFDIAEVSADKGYISKSNLRAITQIGATPLIPFKEGTKVKLKSGDLWTKMFSFFLFHQDEFMKRYHLRSNVESTFHMIKSKFGDSVRSKTDTAMKNEVRAKVLCHNICCLISAIYELGIDPVFSQINN